MSKNYFSEIIKQFTRHRYDPETEEKVQKWLIDESHRADKEKEMRQVWRSLDSVDDPTVYKSLASLHKKLNLPSKNRSLKPYSFLRFVAGFLPLAILAGFIAYYLHERNSYILVAADYGEFQQITLPDQSVVWIQAGSTLKYPRKFKTGDRRVHLSGEAHFSVEKDPARPFIVQAHELSVTVLGTEFSITSYPEDSTATAFVTVGKVKVNLPNEEEYILTDLQSITFDKKNATITLENKSHDTSAGLKNGVLIFEKKTIYEICKVLERHFEVEFKGPPSLFTDRTEYTAKFIHQESLGQILHVLGDMIGFTYQADERTISVQPNKSP